MQQSESILSDVGQAEEELLDKEIEDLFKKIIQASKTSSQAVQAAEPVNV